MQATANGNLWAEQTKEQQTISRDNTFLSPKYLPPPPPRTPTKKLYPLLCVSQQPTLPQLMSFGKKGGTASKNSLKTPPWSILKKGGSFANPQW